MYTAAKKWLAFSSAVDLLYPPKCALCGLLAEQSPCETCRGEMRRNDVRVENLTKGELDFRSSLYLYEGRAAQAVRRLKYSRSTSLVSFMATEIAEATAFWKEFVVVPVPIHWTRLNHRGFNQAELLTSRTPFELLLVRNRATRPQVGLSREQRLENLANAFTVRGKVEGRSILLIDDVVTSGQTARECARTLKIAGSAEVGVLAFCGETEPVLQHPAPLNHNYE